MLALALTLPLLLASADDCYFVSATEIRVLPSCDFSPANVRALREETAEADEASARTHEVERRSSAQRGRSRRVAPPSGGRGGTRRTR